MTDRVSNLDIYTPWFSRDDADFVYIPTLRCGHNWAKRYLLEHGFSEVDHESNKDKTRLMIIREPLDRVLSGVFAREDFNVADMIVEQLSSASFDRRVEEALSKDPHTSPFTNAIPKDGHTDYVFIKFDIDTDYLFTDFLNSRGLTIPPATEQWNREFMGYSSRKLKKQIVADNHMSAKLHDYLKEDYEFYNSIVWYES